LLKTEFNSNFVTLLQSYYFKKKSKTGDNKTYLMRISFIFILSFFYGFSQSIKIVNEKTNELIPFANLTFYKNGKIIDSDYVNENGLYEFESKIEYDELLVSCIGFENKKILKDELILEVHLLPIEYLLEDVIVPNKRSTKTLGFLKDKEKIKIGVGKGIELVVFIENSDQKEHYVKDFSFKIKKEKGGQTAIRLHFYNKSEIDFKPGKELLNKDIIFYFDENKDKGIVNIDVSNYNIELPKEGAFVGIEFVGNIEQFKKEDINTKIEFNENHYVAYTFIRNRKNGIWTNHSNELSNLIPNLGKNKKLNASFAITVFD
jgi:hypothetical protein